MEKLSDLLWQKLEENVTDNVSTGDAETEIIIDSMAMCCAGPCNIRCFGGPIKKPYM